MQEHPSGPLFVRGRIRIFGQDRTLIREDTLVAVSGAAQNMPFCDGSHRRVGSGPRAVQGERR